MPGLKRFFLIIAALVLCPIHQAQSAEGLQVYPLPAIFVSDQAKQEPDFLKALSTDFSGNDRGYAVQRFSQVFRAHFKNAADTIDAKNKYSTFVAYLQVPRVSRYVVKKSESLVDLYMPTTMTIAFTNMVTGEVLYTYTYTHYAKFSTTAADLDGQSQELAKLYRETFDELLESIVSSAKVNFNPRSIEATIRKEWKGLFVLDKGTLAGIVKGDTLSDPEGQMLSIIHAEEEFSVGQPLMGEPKSNAVFAKFANEDIAEIKKPKVMLLKNSGASSGQVSSAKDAMVYQLFINALGKKASFSLLSLDRSFFDVQRAVFETTRLERRLGNQRTPPEYFLSLFIQGPFYKIMPTNKADVSIDEYTVRACGDFTDAGGQIVYSRCADEVITDQIVGDSRFPRLAREEIAVKNVLVKLADDFSSNVRFKNQILSIKDVVNGTVSIDDVPRSLADGVLVTAYHSLGKVDGIPGDVRVPVETLQVTDAANPRVQAASLMKTNEQVPATTEGDQIVLQAMQSQNGERAKRNIAMCKTPGSGAQEDLRKLFSYAVAEGMPYPFYETSSLQEFLPTLTQYGFREWKGTLKTDSELCIEPVIRIESQPGEDSSVKCNLVTGIKLHKNEAVIWKKGMQQEWTFALPVGSDATYVNAEIAKIMYPLIVDISKKVVVTD